MRNGFLAFLVLLSLCLVAQPVWGGTVYVPMALDVKVSNNQFTTEVRFQNDSGKAQFVRYLFIAAQKDGTTFDRETDMTEVRVGGNSTVVLADAVPRGRRGMLEVSAPDEVSVTARMVGTVPETEAETFGVELPVVTSSNAVSPGRTAALPGLTRNEGKIVSDFYLLNLSINRNDCAIEAFKRGGLRVAEQTVSVPPLSVFPFDDALKIVGLTNAADVSFAVTCTELSHPYAIVHKLATAETLYVAPAGGGRSSLDPFPSNECPEGALIQLDGNFHTATRNKERATFFAPTTSGEVYSKLTLTMEFTHGGWHQRTSDNHNIFWLNRTSKWPSNVFGYLNAWGPKKSFIKNTTNASLPKGVIQNRQQGGLLQEGETYVVHYVYDTGANFIEVVVSVKGGEEVVRFQDKPTVNRIVAADNFMVVFGHTSHEAGLEVPSIGWQYANLCIWLQ